VTSKLVCLRFLWGVLLEDKHKVLRAGTGILRTIDYPAGSEVNAQLVAEYVAEAISKRDYFVAHEHAL